MGDRRQGARLHRYRNLFGGVVPPWFPLAACRGQTWLMYDEPRAAVELCAGCAVLDVCRPWAIGPPDPVPYGVAGGMTHRDRQRLRTAVRQTEQCPTIGYDQEAG